MIELSRVVIVIATSVLGSGTVYAFVMDEPMSAAIWSFFFLVNLLMFLDTKEE